MKLIRHRRNKLQELRETPTELGIEMDLRTYGDQLIIHHDPYVIGEPFEPWLAEYRHGTLILNVKEEGLEERLIEMMRSRGIEDYFFLDQSFPFLVRTAKRGERRCAVRLSEFETIDNALNMAGLIDWVWVDCFTRFPLDAAGERRLHEAGFRICLASPELHGHVAPEDIPNMRALLEREGIVADAVCTKEPHRWR
jgi:hypothetical protein